MQSSTGDHSQLELQVRAHADLTQRARGGIVIYLLGWLILSLPTETYVKHPAFFKLNTGLLLLVMVSRLLHLFYCRPQRILDHRVMRAWLVWSILFGALHWGLATAWVLMHPTYAELEFYMVASAAVLGIAGTTALSIAREIRLFFPLFMLVPVVVAFLYRLGEDDLLLAGMVLLAMAYVIVTAKTASNDYWQAICNQMLAEQRARQMEKLSITDQLTQLNNRSYFDRRFIEEWKLGSRRKSPLSILMIDLDYFKKLNDNHGHLFGDQCLQLVAATLRDEIKRETDILSRYGGEEFVVLLADTDAVGAATVGERLLTAVAACKAFHEGEPVALSCSIGGATLLPDHRSDPDNLLRLADAALYQAKDLGRNRYQAAPAPAASIGAAASRAF